MRLSETWEGHRRGAYAAPSCPQRIATYMCCQTTRLTVLCLLLICSSDLSAQRLAVARPTSKPETLHIPLWIDLNWSSSYDDNIFRYSERDLNRWKNDTESYPNPNSTWNDWRNDVGVTLTLPWKHYRGGTRSVVSSWETRFEASAKTALYAVNHRKNYQRYSAAIRQSFGKEFWAEGSFAIVPTFYLREYRDVDLGEYAGCDYESRTYNLTLRYKSPWQTYFYPELEFKTLYYNRHFTEFDAEWTTLGLSAEQFLSKQWLLRGGYRFTNGDNVGGGGLTALSLVTPGEDTEYGDGSFEEHEVNLSASYRPRNIWGKSWQFSLSGGVRIRDYTTNNSLAEDPFHDGRRDIRWDMEPKVTVDILRNLSLFGSYTYEQRDTQSDIGYVSEIKDFVRHAYTVGLDFQLRSPARQHRR